MFFSYPSISVKPIASYTVLAYKIHLHLAYKILFLEQSYIHIHKKLGSI